MIVNKKIESGNIMVHNILAEEKKIDFLTNIYYMGKYKRYKCDEIILLDGLQMQSSSQFVYTILSVFATYEKKEITDYCKQKFPNNHKYGYDQMNDYLREIQIYMKCKKIRSLLIIISDGDKILSSEYDKKFSLELLQGTVFENEINNYNSDIILINEKFIDDDVDAILEITDGPWGNPFIMDYYTNKIPEMEIIPVKSIVLVGKKKYVILKYSRLTKLYTLMECLNYRNEIKVKKEAIKSVIKV